MLSSFGLLSTFGYYLINLENKTLSRAEVVQSKQVQQAYRRQDTPNNIVNITALYNLIKVIDGDTIKVKLINTDSITTVRLLGIDTPETAKSPRANERGVADCMANEATEFIKSLISNKEILLEIDSNKDKYDKYGRLLAYALVKDDGDLLNVNKEMILRGYAHEYTYHGERYKYQKEFKDAQQEAKMNKRGLWADNNCI